MESLVNNKLLFHLTQARQAANEVVDLLRGCCHQIEIAGSIRRGMKQVHDIDIVAWPHYQETGQINLFEFEPSVEPVELRKAVRDNRQFDQISITPKIIRFSYKDYPVEIYLVEPDGNNWGAMLQMRTGSETFNIRLASKAKDMGLIYRAGYGVYSSPQPSPLQQREVKRVDDGSEESVLKVLGISDYYLDPKRRMT